MSVCLYFNGNWKWESSMWTRLYINLNFQVLEETLRLYPAGIVQKEVPPGGMSFMGYDIPAGTTTMVSGI